MKVLQEGKEVKGATVIYSAVTGEPSKVRVNGKIYSASLFEIKEEKATTKKKPATRKTVTKTTAKKPAAKKTGLLSSVKKKLSGK